MFPLVLRNTVIYTDMWTSRTVYVQTAYRSFKSLDSTFIVTILGETVIGRISFRVLY